MTEAPRTPLRRHMHQIIFEADTPLGKFFDLGLLATIAASVAAVMLESVESIRVEYGVTLRRVEWALTIAFTIEYGLRLFSVRRPWNYARSFFGVVDLLAILPTYLSLLIPGAQSLLVIRVLRLLRVFRVLKLVQFVSEATTLGRALEASRRKIMVFLGGVLTIVVIMGTVMYLIEADADSGFTNIPKSVYWAIVTLTTVGYGDIAPKTPLGQLIAGFVMILGYAIIAVPTGIVSAEIAKTARDIEDDDLTRSCPECLAEGHDSDADYCKKCGHLLEDEAAPSGVASTKTS